MKAFNQTQGVFLMIIEANACHMWYSEKFDKKTTHPVTGKNIRYVLLSLFLSQYFCRSLPLSMYVTIV